MGWLARGRGRGRRASVFAPSQYGRQMVGAFQYIARMEIPKKLTGLAANRAADPDGKPAEVPTSVPALVEPGRLLFCGVRRSCHFTRPLLHIRLVLPDKPRKDASLCAPERVEGGSDSSADVSVWTCAGSSLVRVPPGPGSRGAPPATLRLFLFGQ